MNKPRISLYGVQGYGESFEPPCVFCGKGEQGKCVLGVFYYHDYVENLAIKYTVISCVECFKKNIVDKTLNKLYSLPSLLKMKGKSVDREERDLSLNENRLEPVCSKPERLNPLFPSFYGEWISDEEKEAYEVEAFKYQKYCLFLKERKNE